MLRREILMKQRSIEAAERDLQAAIAKFRSVAELAKSPIASRGYAEYVQAAFELRRSRILLERAINGKK